MRVEIQKSRKALPKHELEPLGSSNLFFTWYYITGAIHFVSVYAWEQYWFWHSNEWLSFLYLGTTPPDGCTSSSTTTPSSRATSSIIMRDRRQRLWQSGSQEIYKCLRGLATFHQRLCYYKCKIHISAPDSCNCSIVIRIWLTLAALLRNFYSFVMSLLEKSKIQFYVEAGCS